MQKLKLKEEHKLVLPIFEELKDELQAWNIESVAECAGVSNACIWYWLEGKVKKPRLDTIMKVADAIGFDLKLVKRLQVRPRLTIVRN